VATRKKGRRFTLLIYKRFMDRLWAATLVLGLLLAGVWWQALGGWVIPLSIFTETWVYMAALVVLLFSIFALLARRMGFVQAYADHLRLGTPFLRLKVSYRRVRSVHLAEFSQLFPPGQAGWAEHRLLTPFYGQTAVLVELYEYPLGLGALRFFMPKQMFHPQMTGLVLMVEDWMALSTEIDSLFGDWQGMARTAR
jgi:hypothetical protein